MLQNFGPLEENTPNKQTLYHENINNFQSQRIPLPSSQAV
jgi:hypothetical protein